MLVGQQCAVHALVLQPQHDNHVNVPDAILEIVKYMNPQRPCLGGQQRPRADNSHLADTQCIQGQDLRARDTRMQHVTDDRHPQRCEFTFVLADSEHIEHRLSRMGMATIAGGVLAAYITMLGGADEAMRVFYAKHLLSASIMAAPATIVIAKILMPEIEESKTMGDVKVEVEQTAANVIDAAATGAARAGVCPR